MAFFRSLSALLWKNWQLQKRRLMSTVLEMCVPIACASLMIVLRIMYNAPAVQSFRHSQANANYTSPWSKNTAPSVIAFTSNGPATERMLEHARDVAQEYPALDKINFTTFASRELARVHLAQKHDRYGFLINIMNVSSDTKVLPMNLRYSIKWNQDFKTDTQFPEWAPDRNLEAYKDDYISDYADEGILLIQVVIGRAVEKYWLTREGRPNDTLEASIYMMKMPVPPFVSDRMSLILTWILPIDIIFAYLFPFVLLIRNKMVERDSKIKELLLMTGVPRSAYWASWVITDLIYILPINAALTAMLTVPLPGGTGRVLAHVDPSLLLAFLYAYSFQLIAFGCLLCTLLRRAVSLAGPILLGSTFLNQYLESLDLNPLEYLEFTLFNHALSDGMHVIASNENFGVGTSWRNWASLKHGTELSIWLCILGMLVDTLLYLILAWYFDHVWPGEFGIAKPYSFPLRKDFWFPSEKDGQSKEHSVSVIADSPFFEKYPTDLEADVVTRKLTKSFGRTIAVNGASLKMYKGQITIMMGHTGAGKSTIMDMLSGFTCPSGGTAIVNGLNIRNIAGLRRGVGLCPQRSIHFPTLSVKEHLSLFARLRGTDAASVKAEVLALGREVGLATKFQSRAGDLNETQMRRLCVGIALIGGTTTVFLDEPTEGVDPASRQKIWNVLQRAKQNRTIIVATHQMEEADILGDRLAIMADGVVKCFGSSLFLKKLYSAGSRLVVIKRPECDVDNIVSVVQSHVPDAVLESIVSAVISFLLPEQAAGDFPELFQDFDENMKKMGIVDYSVKSTTMEEVFMKVSEDPSDPLHSGDSEQTLNEDGERRNVLRAARSRVFPEEEKPTTEPPATFKIQYVKQSGHQLRLSRLRAVFFKRAIIAWRHRYLGLLQILLPVAIALSAAKQSHSSIHTIQPELFNFDLQSFDGSHVHYTRAHNANSSPNVRKFADVYRRHFGDDVTVDHIDLIDFESTGSDALAEHLRTMGISHFAKKHIIGIHFGSPQEDLDRDREGNNGSAKRLVLVAVYNSYAIHAEPIAMNYLMNAILQFSLNDSFSIHSSLSLKLENERDESIRAQGLMLRYIASYVRFGIFVVVGLSILPCMAMHFLIEERQVGVKTMQTVAGLDPVTYWSATWAWDTLTVLVPFLLIFIPIAIAYQQWAFIGGGRWALSVLIVVLFCWANFSIVYALYFAFHSPAMGVLFVLAASTFFSLIKLAFLEHLRMDSPSHFLDSMSMSNILTDNSYDILFQIANPPYDAAMCFVNVYLNYQRNLLCEGHACVMQYSFCCYMSDCEHEPCTSRPESYLAWRWPGVSSYLFSLLLQGTLASLILAAVEYRLAQRLAFFIRGKNSPEEERPADHLGLMVDESVKKEARKILGLTPEELTLPDGPDHVILLNLCRVVEREIAVNRLCLGVPQSACLGLLGKDGLWKSCALRMLTGEIIPTSGTAYVMGRDVRKNVGKVQETIGYCPHSDCHLAKLTGRETLTMYGRIRGVPEAEIPPMAEAIMAALKMENRADDLTSLYSAGTSRKLSTACALMGYPPVILLDEPSFGMDFTSRRHLWRFLKQANNTGSTIMLTSHRMDECQALCSTIAFVASGSVKCLGSPEYLKSKFDHGYIVIVQLAEYEDGSPVPVTPFLDFIFSAFHHIRVLEQLPGSVQFQVLGDSIRLADIFGIMEASKHTLMVQDYAVQKMTLDQAFFTLTKTQPSMVVSRTTMCTISSADVLECRRGEDEEEVDVARAV